MIAATDPHSLPAGLPAPVDDGAADHLPGRELPALALPATSGGEIDLAEASRELLVLYCYPRTGGPDEEVPAEWDAIPGARGCTPQSCAFRDHFAELAALGARVLGVSAQPLAEQREFAARERIPYPLLSDPGLALAGALELPTFTFRGRRYLRRLTLIARNRRIAKVFYPIFPPQRNAADVLAWLSGEPSP